MEATLLKQKTKKLSAGLLGLLGLIAGSSANATETFLKPYAGFDVQQRTVKMVPGYGEGLFNKRVPQGNIYVGFDFHEYFGIEVGQEFTQGSTRTTVTGENNFLLSKFLDNPGQLEITQSTLKMQGTHANLVGNIPLHIANAHAILSAGVLILKVKNTVKFIGSEFGLEPPDVVERNSPVFSSRRAISQFSGGLGFNVTRDVKLRILANYETTSQFKNIQNKTDNQYVMSLKNNMSFGFGLNFKFK